MHNITILCIQNKAHKVTGVTLKAEKNQLQLVSKATMANRQMQQHQQGTLSTALARNLHPKNNSNILNVWQSAAQTILHHMDGTTLKIFKVLLMWNDSWPLRTSGWIYLLLFGCPHEPS